MIVDLFERIREIVPVTPAEYVLDLAIDFETQRSWVIELNPFGRPDGLGTGTCLFDCKKDAAVFGEAPFEFRIVTEPPELQLSAILRDGPLKIFLIDNNMISN